MSKHQFYSDLSPLKRAWRALWEKPRGNHKEAVKLNEELIKKIIEGNQGVQMNDTIFSHPLTVNHENDNTLTKLEYFAGFALQGILSNPNVVYGSSDQVILNSINYAKRLINELEKEKQNAKISI